MSRTSRVLTVMLMVVFSLGLGASAQAQATVGTFYDQHTENNVGFGTHDCLPGEYTATETITFTTSGRFVVTASGGFHFQGTTLVVSRIDLSNGYYFLVSGRNHFSFDATATSGQTVSSSGGPETHTLYNAEGQVVGLVKYIGHSHVTYRDLNGNGQPDDGEITSSVDQLHILCI
jgi:hypothetical protein